MINNPVFIVGCSRSGTCFLGEVLKNHPDIHCLIEQPQVFRLANKLVLQSEKKREVGIVKALKDTYSQAWKQSFWNCYRCSSVCQKAGKFNGFSRCQKNKVKRYVDKSHQHILNTQFLLKIFPQAQFIHIVRDGRDVVSSMMQHRSVPNRFKEKYVNENSTWPQPWFGIRDQQHYYEWKHLSLAQKCAQAWLSRVKEGLEAGDEINRDQWLQIRYEDFMRKPTEIMKEICIFLGVEIYLDNAKKAKTSSIGSWKSRMSSHDIHDITKIMNTTLVTLGYEKKMNESPNILQKIY